MIDYLRGILAEKEPGHVTVEANGVGYGASIPLSTYERLPAAGTEVRLLTHYYVREDAHKLFGFFSVEERLIFRQLISVSKIGPKVALNVLSGVSVQDLVTSVNRSDPTRLQKIPGVGAKTAQRLVMELKGKLGISPELSVETDGAKKAAAAPPENTVVKDEVFAAMTALGYNDKQVRRAIDRVAGEIADDASVETWIRTILQVI